MRLIDADAFFEDFPEIRDYEYASQEYEVADARENVHGEWKHIGGDEWCCSLCGYIVTTDGSWEHPKDIGKLFCEHCGADMRGSE